ncbi:MAG: PQQ-binding-like beta-propeller repeat protein [Vicinamibacterales bacterium]
MRTLILTGLATLTVSATLLAADNWPNWRGPTFDGVSRETNLPASWSAKCIPPSASDVVAETIGNDLGADMPDGGQRGQRGRGFGGDRAQAAAPRIECRDFDTENVAWRLALPAYSGSTPIIWEDRIFLNVATADGTGDLELWAIDRNGPTVLWKQPIAGGNHIERKQNMSSPSPVTDGRHVWVMTGVGVLKAFDFDGREVWSRDIQADYGRFGLNWGYASSPLLKDGALFVQVLHGMKTDDPSYVLRIDAATGETVWRVERPTIARQESPDSYTTPAWHPNGGQPEVVITGGDAVTGHDPATGRELWRADILNPEDQGNYRIVASPTVMGDLVLAPSRINPLVAMRPGGRGNVADSHVAWTFTRGPDVPTPVSDGTYVYVVGDNGVVHCLELATGKVVYGPVRLPPGTYSASPLLADGKIYVTTEGDGLTSVFRAGPTFELLSSNSLGDGCSPYCLSSIAVSQGQLFIRSSSHLWAIGERQGS